MPPVQGSTTMVALQESSQQDKADTRLLQVDPNAGSPFSKPMGSARVAHPALICEAASHGETAPIGSLPLDHASLSLINPDVRLLHLFSDKFLTQNIFSFYSFRQMYLCHYLKFHPFSQPGTR